MEINTNPEDRINVKLVPPSAGWRYRAARSRRLAEAEAQAKAAQNPPADQSAPESPEATK